MPDNRNEVQDLIIERNKLLHFLDELTEQLGMVALALVDIHQAINQEHRISMTPDGWIMGRPEAPRLPPVAEIMEAHNRRLDIKDRVAAINRRLLEIG